MRLSVEEEGVDEGGVVEVRCGVIGQCVLGRVELRLDFLQMRHGELGLLQTCLEIFCLDLCDGSWHLTLGLWQLVLRF